VNIAAYDIDGDGIPELALQSALAVQPAMSPGLVWVLLARRRSAEAVESKRSAAALAKILTAIDECESCKVIDAAVSMLLGLRTAITTLSVVRIPPVSIWRGAASPTTAGRGH
jgi:hypothetical protein